MRIGTQDIGTGTRTLVAIVTAETMGLPLEAVKAAIGDTNYPFAPGSGGSVTVASVSPIVRVAAENARDAALRQGGAGAAAPIRRTLVARGGRVQVKDDASKGDDVAGRLQAARRPSRSTPTATWRDGPLGHWHERRAVRRRRSGHRDRRRRG